jgi:hypothetical protein
MTAVVCKEPAFWREASKYIAGAMQVGDNAVLVVAVSVLTWLLCFCKDVVFVSEPSKHNAGAMQVG